MTINIVFKFCELDFEASVCILFALSEKKEKIAKRCTFDFKYL